MERFIQTYKNGLLLSITVIFLAVFVSFSRGRVEKNFFLFIILSCIFIATYPFIKKIWKILFSVSRDAAAHITIQRSLLFTVLGLMILYGSTYVFYAYWDSLPKAPATEILIGLSLIFFNIAAVIAVYLWLTFIAYNIGSRVIAKYFKIAFTEVEHFLVSVGMGLYGIILFYFLLTSLRLLVVGLPLLIGFTCIRTYQLRRHIVGFLGRRVDMKKLLGIKDPGSKTLRLFLSVLLLLIFFGFMHFAQRIGAEDDLISYWNIATTYLAHDGFVRFPLFPANEMTFSSTYLIMPLAQLFAPSTSLLSSYIFSLLLLLIAHEFAKRYSIRAIIIGLCLMVTYPNFFLFTVRPDILLSFFIALAILCILKIDHANDRVRAVILSGFFTGAAISAKYNAILFIPLLAILALYQARSWKTAMTHLTVAGAMILVAFAPWALFNSIEYNNPLHPFFEKGTQNFYLSSSLFQNASENKKIKEHYTSEYLFDTENNINNSQSGLQNFMIMSLVNRGWSSSQLGPFVLILFLLLAVNGSADRFTRILLFGTILSYILWDFIEINQIHYLYFLIPWVLFLVASQLDRLKNRFVIFAVTGLVVFWNVLLTNPAATIKAATMNLSNNEAFIARSSSWVDFKNETIDEIAKTDPSYVILILFAPFYANVKDSYLHVYQNAWDYTWLDVASGTENAEKTIAELKRRGITHLGMVNIKLIDAPDRCTEIACPITHALYLRAEELRAMLPVAIQNDYLTIYSVE